MTTPFRCSGPLPDGKSKSTRNRTFSYLGWGLLSGILIVEGERELDWYLVEWDPEGQCWLVANQTDKDGEIYQTTTESCTCWGGKRWGFDKHSQALRLLVEQQERENRG